MAFTARLFMLLAIAVSILALPVFGTVKLSLLARTDALPEEYPPEEPEREDTRTMYMDHYIFECFQRYPFITKELTLEGWRTYLLPDTWAPDFRWASYEIVSEDPPMFKMVINGINSEWGLSKRMEQSEQAVPEGSRQSADGSIALLFSRDLPVLPMWTP